MKPLNVILPVLLILPMLVMAQGELEKAIQEQVNYAENCETLAYSMELKNLEADEVFNDCVERRAILIGMQKRYGVGQYGEIDIFDKIEGYQHLSSSSNPRIKKIADTYATAAGGE